MAGACLDLAMTASREQSKASSDESMQKNYVEYGRRLEKMIQDINAAKR